MSNALATKPEAKPLLSWGFGETEESDVEFEWECLCDELTSLMQKINKGGKWFATVENQGWLARSGWQTFEATNGSKLLSRLMHGDSHFRIFVEGKGFGRHFKIQHFHHDSPCGAEWFTVRRWNAARDPAA